MYRGPSPPLWGRTSVRPDFVIRTKLQPPEPLGGHIARPRLTAALERSLQHRLTLVVAEAGWGKTCALTQLRDLERPLVWLSLDPADSDPAALAAHLLAGFDSEFPGLAERVRGREPGNPADVIGQLANALVERGNPLVFLVLDDLHRIEGGGMAVVGELLVRAPSGVRVVAASRRWPDLPLARLRADGSLSILMREQLAFDRNEIASFVGRLYGRRVNPVEVEALATRTEGWPVALRLMAEGCLETTFKTPSGFDWLRQYFDEEILPGLEADDRLILSVASFLNRFDAQLLATVLDRTDVAARLKVLADRGGLLVESDFGDGYLRLHSLMRDLLRERAERDPGPEEVGNWHRRAGAAWEVRGEYREAVEHYLLAGCMGEAARAMERLVPAIMDVPALETVEGWLARLDEAYRHRPAIRFLAGHVAHRRGHFKEAIPHLRAALSHFRATKDQAALHACGLSLFDVLVSSARWRELLGLTVTLGPQFLPGAFRQLVGALRHAALGMTDRLAGMEPAGNAATDGDASPLTPLVWMIHAHFILVPLGRLEEAAGLLERAVERMKRRDPFGRLVIAVGLSGCARFDLGQWDEARTALLEAVQLAGERGWPGYGAAGRVMGARIAVTVGDDEEATRLLAEAYAAAGSGLLDMYGCFFAPVVAALLAARAGDLPGRDREAAVAQAALERVGGSHHRAQGLIELALAYLETDDFAEAGALAGQALSAIRCVPVPVVRARAHVLMAAARHGFGDELGAVRALQAAVREADSRGLREILIRREGRILARLGGLIPRRGLPPDLAAVLDGAVIPSLAENPVGLNITSLGDFAVTLNGRPVTNWGRRKAKQIFKLLLTTYPVPVSADSLVETFWPQMDWDAARGNLWNAVSHLRRTLAQAGIPEAGERIRFADDAYQLVLSPPDHWDVDEIRRLAAIATAGDLAAAKRIVALMRGDFLPADRYEEWVEPVRREMVDTLRHTLRQLRAAASRMGDPTGAVTWAKHLVRLDPLDEEEQRQLIALLIEAGQTEQAQQRFNEFAAVLALELGVAPAPETRALVEAIRATRSGGPMPRSSPASKK